MNSKQPSRGELTTITGPVQSAKSTDLRSILIRKKSAGFNIRLIEHEKDTRYVTINETEEDDCLRKSSTTHLGDRCGIHQSIISATLHDIPSNLLEDVDYIGIDEGQFFEVHLIPFVEEYLRKGVHVIVSGLLSDFNLEPFLNIQRLEIMATTRISKLGTCNAEHRSGKRHVCGKDAPWSYKIGGDPSLNVEIGGPEMYRPVCPDCYFKLKKDEIKIVIQ
jgi:thymidine kinase